MDDEDDSEIRFAKFKASLAEQITLSNCRRLCTFFNLPPATHDRILNKEPPGVELLNVLTENKLINCYDVTKLEEALRKQQLNKAAEKAKMYQQSEGRLNMELIVLLISHSSFFFFF